MKKLFWFTLLIVTVLSCKNRHYLSSYVKVENGVFTLDGQLYTFAGANYWQGMNLGSPESGNREQLIRELDQLKEMGVTNLRILAGSEADSAMRYAVHPALQTAPGVYNNDLWLGLDFLLAEMAKRNMKAVMVLSNFWTWSGGFPQYLIWAGDSPLPYPQDEGNSWDEFQLYSARFYSNAIAQEMYKNHILKVIERKNSATGVVYKNDPTIMAWQLANEPRGIDQQKQFRAWTRQTSNFIKSIDVNHLVCLGTEGNTASEAAGVNVLHDNDDPNIDYITMHIWPQNWGWFKPGDPDSVYIEAIANIDGYWDDHIQAAIKLSKPIVLEEFGIARDSSSFYPSATTLYRDKIFTYILNKTVKSVQEGYPVRGFNFWSYSGEARPNRPGEFWKCGDPFLGDPPHELQGWYGVYDKDESTKMIIRNASEALMKY